MSWFLVFLVSWFLGFLDSWFRGFLVSWFQRFEASKSRSFKVSKIQTSFNVFWKIWILYYQIVIPGFLENIHPMSKLFKKSSDGSSDFCRARLFPHVLMIVFPNFWGFQKDVSTRIWDVSQSIWMIFVSPKLNIRFWGSWTRPKIRKSWKWRVSGFSHNEIEKLLVLNEAE